MKRLATRFLGLLLVPAAAAWAFTSEPQTSNTLPSASDYSQTVLPERSDALSWKTLGQVEPSNANGKLIPKFSKEILALDKKDVKVIGFMVPIEPDAKHTHFVLSAVPPSCPFCMPAGPESMVEVWYRLSCRGGGLRCRGRSVRRNLRKPRRRGRRDSYRVRGI